MQPQLGIWKRLIRSLLGVDRCSLIWGSGRGLLEVYSGWTDAASAGDQEEVYLKFIEGGQMQPYPVIPTTLQFGMLLLCVFCWTCIVRISFIERCNAENFLQNQICICYAVKTSPMVVCALHASWGKICLSRI